MNGLFEDRRNRSLSSSFDGITSLKRPDAVDLINNILYELKPYHRDSFRQAIKQTEGYLNEINKSRPERWIVVIDMYY